MRPTLADRAARASVTTLSDHYTLARELVKQHEFKRTIPLLAETTRLDPQHFWAWHYLGNCHFELLNFSEALICYSACRGLNPDPAVEYFPHYHLALVNAAQGRFAAALDDVNRSIACLSALPPDVAAIEQSKPYLLKARILAGQKNPISALAALTIGLKAAPQSMELLFERANVRRAAATSPAPMPTGTEAFKIPPATEIGWNVRGLGSLARRSRRGLGRLRNGPQDQSSIFTKHCKTKRTYSPSTWIARPKRSPRSID